MEAFERMLDDRENQDRQNLNKYSKEEIIIMDGKKQIEHYKKLIKRADTKIKSATSRKKTYEKRIRVMQRRMNKVEV